MTFIFIDPPSVESVGTNTAALATDTATAGAQASSLQALPPGLDPQSSVNVAVVNQYISQATAQLTASGVLQNNRSDAILLSAMGYTQTDVQNATGLSV
jgi:hypothetical protein